MAARLTTEDALQEAGLVTDEQRSTCPTCRVWVTFGHAEHADHDVDHDAPALPDGGSRPGRRRAAIIAAAVVETSLLCQLAGYLTRDRWAHLVPADLAWRIAGGLVAAAAVVSAGWALAQWWGGWWPYRHNRLLDTPPHRTPPHRPNVHGTDVTGGGV